MAGTVPYAEVFFMSDSDPTLVVLTPDGVRLAAEADGARLANDVFTVATIER